MKPQKDWIARESNGDIYYLHTDATATGADIKRKLVAGGYPESIEVFLDENQFNWSLV